jgi:hypothetical protein
MCHGHSVTSHSPVFHWGYISCLKRSNSTTSVVALLLHNAWVTWCSIPFPSAAWKGSHDWTLCACLAPDDPARHTQWRIAGDMV